MQPLYSFFLKNVFIFVSNKTSGVMLNKYLKIFGCTLLVAGFITGLSLSLRQKPNWEMLMKENIEALTTPEDNPDYPCVKSRGFCFKNGVSKDNLAILVK